MNFKKITAVFAVASVIGVSLLSPVYATEQSTEETTEPVITESEEITSEDSQWTYKIITNEETKESYASLESYLGSDTEIVIPEEIEGNIVRQLGEYTFYENSSITKITISENLTDFERFPFFACTALKEFEVNENNEIYSTKDGVLLGDDEQLFVCYPPAKPDTEYAVPDGVIALKTGAFATCTNLKKITFPDTLEMMDAYCFAECTSLNNVVIPDRVSELSPFNFTGCTSLTDIKLNDDMHTIGNGAFYACTSLDSITFPKYIIEIGQCAFTSTAFTEIEVPSTVQKIGYSAFGYTTDQQGQIIPMDSFTVKGLTGSMAQAYCGENEHVTFKPVDEEAIVDTTQQATDTDEKSDEKASSGIKPGIIVAIATAGAVIIIAVIVITVKVKSRKNSDEESSEQDNTDAEENSYNSDENNNEESEEYVETEEKKEG